jgi:Phosphopantetheine attachment site
VHATAGWWAATSPLSPSRGRSRGDAAWLIPGERHLGLSLPVRRGGCAAVTAVTEQMTMGCEPQACCGSGRRYCAGKPGYTREVKLTKSGALEMPPLRATITSLFEQVAQEQQRKLAPLSDDLKLLQSGLDSLSFALIVARLEDALGYDPFESADTFPVTFGDFVKLYENRST